MGLALSLLMEALLSMNDAVDGAGVCDSLFALLDMDIHDDSYIPGRSDHLLFTEAERVVPVRYPIKIPEPTAMDKFLDAEHNEFLKQGISNVLELPQHIQEYLRRQQDKQKQHMINIQAPYIVVPHLRGVLGGPGSRSGLESIKLKMYDSHFFSLLGPTHTTSESTCLLSNSCPILT